MNIKNAILLLPKLDWGYLDKCLDIDEYTSHLKRLGFGLKMKTPSQYVLRRKKNDDDHVIVIVFSSEKKFKAYIFTMHQYRKLK